MSRCTFSSTGPCLIPVLAAWLLLAVRPVPGSAAPQAGPASPTMGPSEARSWARSVVDTLDLPDVVGQLLVLREQGDRRTGGEAASARPREDDRAVLEGLLRTGAGGLSLCTSSPRRLRNRVRTLRDTSTLPLSIELRPDCRSSTSPDSPGAFASGWPRAVLATRDPELVERLGGLIGRLGRFAGIDRVSSPEWSVESSGSPSSEEDTLSALVRRYEDAYAAVLVRHGLQPGEPAIPPARQVETSPVAGGGTPPGAARPRTVSLGPSDSLAASAVRAFARGAERVYVPAGDRTVRRALVQAAREGRLDTARLRTSARRSLAVRKRLAARRSIPVLRKLDARRPTSPPPSRARPVRSSERAEELDRSIRLMREEIARRSVTLVLNRGALLPLSPYEEVEPTSRILHVRVRGASSAGGRAVLRDAFDRASGLVPVTHAVLTPHTSRERYSEITRAALRHRAVVVSVRACAEGSPTGPLLTDRQRSWIDDVNQEDVPLIVLGLGAPRLLLELDRPEATLLAYTSDRPAQLAAVDALFGRAAIGGRLPGSLSASLPSGSGIDVPQQTLRRGAPGSVGMNPRTLDRIDRVVREAIADSAFPGAAVAVGRAGVLVKLEGYGHHTYESVRPITPRSRFDLASLTKVVGTTPAVMQLYETDRISLDAPATQYWPEFGQNGKERVTVRHLLTHTGGLRPFHHPVHVIPGSPYFSLPLPYTPFYRLEMLEKDDMYGFIARDSLQFTPGTEYEYSDLGMITAAHLVERITGGSLDAFLREQVYEPAGMRSTGYRSTGPRAVRPQIVPTERDYSFRLRVIQGEVHDEAAYIMGGTAGHAGLFSNAVDLARYADLLIRGGRSPGGRVFRPRTIDLFTRPVSPERHTRALGWDTRSEDGYSSAGELFGPSSFGHTGFTGTSLWIDPDRDLYVILLTNRVHPNRYNRGHIDVRPAVADLAYRALEGPPVTLIPGNQ